MSLNMCARLSSLHLGRKTENSIHRASSSTFGKEVGFNDPLFQLQTSPIGEIPPRISLTCTQAVCNGRDPISSISFPINLWPSPKYARYGARRKPSSYRVCLRKQRKFNERRYQSRIISASTPCTQKLLGVVVATTRARFGRGGATFKAESASFPLPSPHPLACSK